MMRRRGGGRRRRGWGGKGGERGRGRGRGEGQNDCGSPSHHHTTRTHPSCCTRVPVCNSPLVRWKGMVVGGGGGARGVARRELLRVVSRAVDVARRAPRRVAPCRAVLCRATRDVLRGVCLRTARRRRPLSSPLPFLNDNLESVVLSLLVAALHHAIAQRQRLRRFAFLGGGLVVGQLWEWRCVVGLGATDVNKGGAGERRVSA